MPLPKIEIQGRVIGEPTLRFTAQGVANLNFRLVASKSKPDGAGGWTKAGECWLDVVVWPTKYVNPEKLAETVKDKTLVMVLGELQTRAWVTKDGEKRNTTEVKASTVYAIEENKNIKPEIDPWADVPKPQLEEVNAFEPPF